MEVRLRGEKRTMELTCGVYEGSVELLGEQRVRHVPEELLQESSHIMNAVFFVQLDFDTTIKLLT